MKPLPPGNSGLPLVGETPSLLFDPNFVRKRFDRYGPIFRTHIVGKPTVYMVGPEALEFLLSTGMKHFTWGDGWPQTFRDLLGRSLFLQDGAEHQRNRKLIMPAFHGSALNGYVATIDRLTRDYCHQWEQIGEFPCFLEFKKLTFEIASQIFLGAAPGNDTQRLSRLFGELTDGLFSFVDLPWSKYRRGMRARGELLTYLDRVIAERTQNPQTDALSLLIQATDETGDRLSPAEIRNQALLMLFAGHETTTAMLSWWTIELARHPEVLAAARAEQQQLGDAPLTLEYLNQMPVLDRIWNEIERLHPPVAGGFRGVVAPFEFNGYGVPAGWLVSYSILLTHYLPDIYPEPDRFFPDRWLDRQYKPFSLVGFGGGPRICIGIAFAKLEMRLVASYLLRHYRWELSPHRSIEPVLIPTRRPKDNGWIKFQRLTDSSRS